MRAFFRPSLLKGEIAAPPSKSVAHRYLISAGLAYGESQIRGISDSEDMHATLDLLTAMGAIYRKEKDTVPELPGFERIESIPIRFGFAIEGDQIQNLFSMTPHVFRIGKEGAERLRKTEILSDTASCVLNVFRVIG
jgi:hypothetical protein